MGGNPFYTQARPGKNEKIFKLIKFRSMTNKKDENGELLPDEIRLTTYGKILRKTSLDELPEAINILLGHMSIIGPRPLLVQYLERYNEEQKQRHNVRPGLSGLAQVNGRNAISWEQKFFYDVKYVNTYTFFGDIKILFQTVFKAFVKVEGISQEDNATMQEFCGGSVEKKRILIFANSSDGIRIFRKDLIKGIYQRNTDITVVMPCNNLADKEYIESFGCKILNLAFDRRGMNPIKDFKLIKAYKKIIHDVNPDMVLTFTIKCNIYGAYASKRLKTHCYIFVTGLGSMFQNGGIKKKIGTLLYKLGTNKIEKAFFENQGNKSVFVDLGIVKEEKTVVMPGAGVNLEDYPFFEYPSEDQPIRFLFVGRMMKEKGIEELFSAVENLKKLYQNIEFDFIGGFEDNYKEKVDKLVDLKLINYYGFQNDTKPFVEKSHCVVLPSYHEGMSNTLLEGAAMGRPLIASDIFGCKEAIINGETGYVCKPKLVESLQEVLEKFIKLDYVEKLEMGKKSHEHISKTFDKKVVVVKTIEELFLN